MTTITLCSLLGSKIMPHSRQFIQHCNQQLQQWCAGRRCKGKQTHNVAYAVVRDESVALIDQLFMYLCQVRQVFFSKIWHFAHGIRASSFAHLSTTACVCFGRYAKFLDQIVLSTIACQQACPPSLAFDIKWQLRE